MIRTHFFLLKYTKTLVVCQIKKAKRIIKHIGLNRGAWVFAPMETSPSGDSRLVPGMASYAHYLILLKQGRTRISGCQQHEDSEHEYHRDPSFHILTSLWFVSCQHLTSKQYLNMAINSEGDIGFTLTRCSD